MNTDRIERLNSLLERIKRNAALPKQLLGKGLFMGGTPAPRSDVSTGPSVPAAVQHATPSAPKVDAAAESAVRAQAIPPTTPTQVPPSPSISTANLPQAHAPMVAMPSVSGTMLDSRKPRQRVATMIGVAVPPTPKRETPIEEIDLDQVELVDAPSSEPTPTRASATEASTKSAGAEQRVEQQQSQTETRKPDSDIDNLSWSEPPAEEAQASEPPPLDSSRRPRVAGSIDEALAEVTAGTELEIPIKTPPPESGKQPTEGVYAAAVPSAATVPTAEQLGDILELEEPTVADLELDLGHAKSEPVKEELELELPPQRHVLEPPASQSPAPEFPTSPSPAPEPEHRAPEPSHVEEIAVESSPAVTAASAQGDDTLLSDSESLQLQPDVTPRKKSASGVTVELLQSARGFAPRSFVELLDASLKLGSTSK